MRFLVVAVALGMGASALVAADTTSTYDRATTALEAARSRHADRKWQEAAGLWDHFIAGPGVSSDKLPFAYLMLADCHWQMKDLAKCEAATDELIKRFYPSRFWLYAYGTKLICIRELKDNDRYLNTVQALIQRAGYVPPQLWGINQPNGRAVEMAWYREHRLPWEPWAVYAVPVAMDWSVDLIAMSDTPERASRAIKMLEKMFGGKVEDIPLDWQHAHVCLLRQSGDTAGAQKLLKTYMESWGRDPRAVELGLLQARYLDSRKEIQTADAIWKQLIKDFGGYGNLERPLGLRIHGLVSEKRLEEVGPLAREYVRLFPISTERESAFGWWEVIVNHWLDYARALAEKGNPAEMKDLLAYLDEAGKKQFPCVAHDGLPWRLRGCAVLKDADGAVKVAEEMLGDSRWSGENFQMVLRLSESIPPLAKVVEAARAKRKIPVPDRASRAAGMFGDMMKRLAEDQPRFAEEIAQELFDKHREDAATIDAAAEMASYYYKKVLAEPRDKWMNRMVEAWPQNPRTQDTLRLQIQAEQGQRNYPRVAAVCETAMRLFPGAAAQWYSTRCEAFSAVQDKAGAAAFMRSRYGERVKTDPGALYRVLAYEREAKPDLKAFGDQWMEMAKRLAGTRGEVFCLQRAYDEYVVHSNGKLPEQGKDVVRLLRKQTLDGQARWSFEFAEAGILAMQRKGTEAARAMADALANQTGLRDLYGRIYYLNLAAALAEEKKLEDGLALAKKMRAACPSKEDRLAVAWFEASLLERCEQKPAAGKKYLELIDGHPMPGLMGGHISYALACLGHTPEMHTAAQKLIKEYAGAQDVIPEVLYIEGASYLRQKQMAGVNQVRGMLTKKYAASAWRDKLEDEVQATLNPKKPPGNK